MYLNETHAKGKKINWWYEEIMNIIILPCLFLIKATIWESEYKCLWRSSQNQIIKVIHFQKLNL